MCITRNLGRLGLADRVLMLRTKPFGSSPFGCRPPGATTNSNTICLCGKTRTLLMSQRWSCGGGLGDDRLPLTRGLAAWDCRGGLFVGSRFDRQAEARFPNVTTLGGGVAVGFSMIGGRISARPTKPKQPYVGFVRAVTPPPPAPIWHRTTNAPKKPAGARRGLSKVS